MATKRLIKQQLTRASATKEFNLGERLILPATTQVPEREFMYVQYNDGTGNLTASTYMLLVPYNAGSGCDLTQYTLDKTDLSSYSMGKFCGVCMAHVSTTSSKYIWVQVRGESHIRLAKNTFAQGDPIVATPVGTDGYVERLQDVSNWKDHNTYTTLVKQVNGSVFGFALDAAATGTSALPIYLKGF